MFVATLPTDPLGYVDLHTLYATVSKGLRTSSLVNRRRAVDADWNVLVVDLCNAGCTTDNLERLLTLRTFSVDAGHWRELAKRRVPKDPTHPYVVLMIGRRPVDLTSMDRFMDGRVNIELYTARDN